MKDPEQQKQLIENEIRETMGNAITYDLESMFPKREGFGARRQIRAKLKLLKNLLPSLITALLESEELIYVARGCVMKGWEQFFAGGLAAHYANITCVVLTDRRILLVNCQHSGKQKHFRNQVLYTEIADIKMRSFLSNASRIKLKDGKSILIGGFKATDKKQMESLIPERMAEMPAEAPCMDKSVQYVCPHCATIYTNLESECAHCGSTFKSPQKAAMMSLILPGLGDLYLGHTAFGVMEMIGSLFEWLVLIGAILSYISKEKDAQSFLVTWIIIMVLTNVIDYFLTKAMGRKGLIAASKPYTNESIRVSP